MKKIFYILFVVLTTVRCTKESTAPTGNQPINALNILAVGKSGHDLLSTDTYSSLSIEIQYMPGMELLPESVNNLHNFLETYLDKPGGITITQKQVTSFAADTVSIQQVADFETANRSLYTKDNVIAVYILVSDASNSSPTVLGTSYLNTSIVLYEKSIRSHSGGFAQATREKVESGVMEHEFGHLMGLVNDGIPMVTPHEDLEHQHHCTNTNCLMYYEIETSGLTRVANHTIPSLDANCINDLRASGGK
jgi:hypothetical protein